MAVSCYLLHSSCKSWFLSLAHAWPFPHIFPQIFHPSCLSPFSPPQFSLFSPIWELFPSFLPWSFPTSSPLCFVSQALQQHLSWAACCRHGAAITLGLFLTTSQLNSFLHTHTNTFFTPHYLAFLTSLLILPFIFSLCDQNKMDTLLRVPSRRHTERQSDEGEEWERWGEEQTMGIAGFYFYVLFLGPQDRKTFQSARSSPSTSFICCTISTHFFSSALLILVTFQPFSWYSHLQWLNEHNCSAGHESDTAWSLSAEVNTAATHDRWKKRSASMDWVCMTSRIHFWFQANTGHPGCTSSSL